MGMNIKDLQVHAMARELSDHRVANLTEAVRQALRAELDRCFTAAPGQEEVARRQELQRLLSRCRDGPWADQRRGKELQAELYDDTGLPAVPLVSIHWHGAQVSWRSPSHREPATTRLQARGRPEPAGNRPWMRFLSWRLKP
jgi:hypothetical protein